MSEVITPSTKCNKLKNIGHFPKQTGDINNIRIIQKSMVYIIGLSGNLANKEVGVFILRLNLDTLEN